MTTTRTALAIVSAARAATRAADNDNAGDAWTARDTEANAHDSTHLATRVYLRTARTVYVSVTDEVEPRDWRVDLLRTGRMAVSLSPRATRCRMTERVERLFRALLRAQGVECC